MKKHFSKFLTIALFSLTAQAALADRFNASFSIVQPIALQETTRMDFGAVLANDFESCVLGEDGIRTGSACYGAAAGTLSSIRLLGSLGMQVYVMLHKGFSPDSEMIFNPVLIDNGQGTGSATSVTIQEDHYLSLGGTLTILNGVDARENNVSHVDYQVEVTYQ